MTYIDTFAEGLHVTAEEWYKPGLIYVNLACIKPGQAVSRPAWEKAFLLRMTPETLRDWLHTIVTVLSFLPERRDADGRLLETDLQH